MRYVLENSEEGARLERQAHSRLYDPATELSGFLIKNGDSILDAGCGSGAVARLLAEQYPDSHVTGIDASRARIAEAKKLALGLDHLKFVVGSLNENIPDKFDRIICRYVLEHMAPKEQSKVVGNLVAVLQPQGQLRLIDIDGYMQNIFPRTPLVDECLKRFQQIEEIDLFVGRKLNSYLTDAGLQKVSWSIQTLVMNEPKILHEEVGLIQERFQNSLAAMAAVLNSETKARNFQAEYLELLTRPGTCLFYNKFLATGEKAASHVTLVKG